MVNEIPAKRIPYGCDDLGRLESVMVHTPGEELALIDEHNYRHWLFDRCPEISLFTEEHQRYCELLRSNGVAVLQVADHIGTNKNLLRKLPNLTYMHDIAVVTRKGAILSRMAWDGRKGEEIVVREALSNLSIPILMEFDEEGDAFEGCLLLSPECILVAETERHSRVSVRKFIFNALRHFKEVIYADIPKARRFMHPDTVFNRVRTDLALAYMPAFSETVLFRRTGAQTIDIAPYLKSKGIEVVPVSDSEQQRLACSFVPLDNGVIAHYDTALDRETVKLLSDKKIEFVFFHPDALTAGGGSLRCITLRLCRRCPGRSPDDH
jgi:arginine deiminase